MGVLETHDDGERDGPALTGLSRHRGDGNAGDDGLRVVGGMEWGRNIWRHVHARVTGKGSVGIDERLSTRILEEKEKSVTFSTNPNALNQMTVQCNES